MIIVIFIYLTILIVINAVDFIENRKTNKYIKELYNIFNKSNITKAEVEDALKNAEVNASMIDVGESKKLDKGTIIAKLSKSPNQTWAEDELEPEEIDELFS